MKLFLLTIALAGTLAAQDANPQNGKKLFARLGCYACHGYLGQGGGAGVKLAPNPVSLARLTAYVRHPSATMPPYTAKVVSDAELADIRAYLASVPAPPPLKSIPLLNQ